MIVAAPASHTRPGYTLLEVILASAIALFVLIALYMFMQVSLRQVGEGRDAVERATLARGIINRIHNDLTPCITPPSAKPKSKSSSSGNQSGATANMGTTGGTTGGATTTGGNTSGGTTTAATGSDTSTTDTETQTIAAAIPLQAGVIGTENVLTIYTTRVPDPRYVATANEGEEVDAPSPSDIRRIVYWVAENGGLCRQEITWVTGENVYNVDGPIIESDKSERDYMIAPEVSAISFEYYDINATTDESGWTTEYDGRELGPDMLTSKGPPTAIRVSFTIKFQNAHGEETTRDYKHVIPIVTASGPNTTDELQSPDATDTTTGSTTGSTTTTTTGR